MPFPVHVVERVETYDRISRNRFVTRYKYHHGYFDGEEREFRGFGMVEQFDTEAFAALTADLVARADQVVQLSMVAYRAAIHAAVRGLRSRDETIQARNASTLISNGNRVVERLARLEENDNEDHSGLTLYLESLGQPDSKTWLRHALGAGRPPMRGRRGRDSDVRDV